MDNGVLASLPHLPHRMEAGAVARDWEDGVHARTVGIPVGTPSAGTRILLPQRVFVGVIRVHLPRHIDYDEG